MGEAAAKLLSASVKTVAAAPIIFGSFCWIHHKTPWSRPAVIYSCLLNPSTFFAKAVDRLLVDTRIDIVLPPQPTVAVRRQTVASTSVLLLNICRFVLARSVNYLSLLLQHKESRVPTMPLLSALIHSSESFVHSQP